MLFQMFNVFNARSDTQSAFSSSLHEWSAVGSGRRIDCPPGLVVYVPFLQRAFGTVALSAGDWAFCFAVASSVLWLREASKAIARARR